MKFRLPTLPFGHAELEPFLSSEAIDSHYFGHHKSYVDKTNELLGELGMSGVSLEKIILNHEGKLFENAAQAWNHTFYWLGLRASAKQSGPDGELLTAIEKSFGSVEGMKARFLDCGQSVFGSGWTWLVARDDKTLDIMNTSNADNPIRLGGLRPLWVCDVWEHANYIDYRNERREYLEGAWTHLNWDFVQSGFLHQRMANMSRLMTAEDPVSGIASAWM